MTLTDKLIDDLAKPTYVLRMARANENSPNSAMRTSARKRAAKARLQIRRIALKYGEDIYKRDMALRELTVAAEETPYGYR